MRLLAVIPLIFSVLTAHGVETVRVQTGIVGLRAFYDDGSPLAYVDVTVFSPEDKETEFQSGLADKNGVFTFRPDQDGTWTIIFDDGLGHGTKQEINITAAQVVPEEGEHVTPRWQKIVVGLSLIFGMTGLLYGMTVQRRSRS